MFPKRWHHGHSLVVGTLAGMAVTQRPYLLLAAGVLLGVALTLATIGGRRLAGELLAAFRTWRRRGQVQAEDLRPGVRPVYARTRSQLRDEEPIPYA